MRLFATKSPEGLYGPPRATEMEAWMADGFETYEIEQSESYGWTVVPVRIVEVENAGDPRP